MIYLAPVIDAAGLHIPAYSDIRDDLLSQFRQIYGQNVYLGTDSADYQWISAIALKVSDTMQAVQLAYNGRSPATAIGADLDSIVKMNGLARKAASFSTAIVTLTGTANTAINNGIVTDVNGFGWNIPSFVTIPLTGSINVTAMSQNPGNINANPGDISIISTPTAGWTGVTNANSAVAGQPIEKDSQLRARQALSVALPALTMLASTTAAVAAVSGVTRYNIVENPTGSVDAFGNPPHSVTAVVEGGTDLDVATAIYQRRGIGCYTNGTTSVPVTDPNTGQPMTINFYRPTYVPIFAALNIHPLAGYTSATTAAIESALAAYLNSLQIGEEVTISALYGAAMNVTPNLSQPLFSIRGLAADITSTPTAIVDIPVAFSQVANGQVANISVTLV